jgi:hypothetical protein
MRLEMADWWNRFLNENISISNGKSTIVMFGFMQNKKFKRILILSVGYFIDTRDSLLCLYVNRCKVHFYVDTSKLSMYPTWKLTKCKKCKMSFTICKNGLVHIGFKSWKWNDSLTQMDDLTKRCYRFQILVGILLIYVCWGTWIYIGGGARKLNKNIFIIYK